MISTKIIFWIFFLVLIWLLGWKEKKSASPTTINRYWLLLPVVILIISRLLPFFHWGEFPLGADAGVYIKEWGQYLSPELFYVSHIILNLLLGLAIYLVTKEYFGAAAGFFSFLIFSLAVSQFLAYWAVYFKMTAAIILTLISFYLLKRKRWLMIVTVLLTGLIHPLAFLPLALTLGCLIFTKENRRLALGTLILNLPVLIFLKWEKLVGFLYYNQQYFQNINQAITESLTGHFVSLDVYQNFLALIYLPLALLGFIRLIADKKFNALFFYSIVNLVLIYLNLAFYSRFVVLLDVVAVILSGPILLELTGLWLKNNIGRIALIIALLVAIINIFYQSWTIEPLINSAELKEIKALAKLSSDTLIVTPDFRYEPILAAFSQHSVVTKENFDQNYTGPVYFYQGRRSP